MIEMSVAIIGDYASQYYLIGKELEKQGFLVTYFLQTNRFANLPSRFHKLGSVQGPLWKNYIRTGFWMIAGKILKKFDIQLVNGTYPSLVRAKNSCFHYHGSDLRLGTVKPKTPSFISLKELLNYSPRSIFLPRCANPEHFYPIKEIKEKKENFKDEKGIDFIVGHFAHSPEIKASHLIEQAIEKINQNNDLNIYFINQAVPREKILEKINFCDLVIDHVNPKTGLTYNVLSIESLLCNVSVASYYDIRFIDFEEMREIVNYLDPINLEQHIIKALQKPTIGEKRTIAKKYHSPKSVVKVMLNYWKKWNFI